MNKLKLTKILSSALIIALSLSGCKSDKRVIEDTAYNQDSEYKQYWIDYLAYKDAELGRTGTTPNISERDYALQILTDMLREYGVENYAEVALKTVNDNLGGK